MKIPNRPRLHYHSDCYFFAGCENMLVNFWSSDELRKDYEVSFSYGYSQQYERGLRDRASFDFPVYPLQIPEVPDFLPASWPLLLKRILLRVLRIAFGPYIVVAQAFLLWRLFSNIAPQVLHINNGGYPGALSARTAAVAARLARIPTVVMVVNNFAVGYSRPDRWFGYILDRWVVASVGMFVTGSKAAAERLKNVLRLPESQCISIHNGIRLRAVSETVEETRKRLGLHGFSGLVLGVVAILRPNKGHVVLLEAIKCLVNDNPDIRCKLRILIEGDGPSRESLIGFVKRNNLQEVCIFAGNEPNVMNFIQSLDVLVLPSIGQEDFPNVILEAMGLGKAVIASRLAGTPEQVVDNVTGLLVEPSSEERLAEAIHRLLLNEAQVRAMGKAGLQRFEKNFSADKSVASYLNLYRVLTEGELKDEVQHG